jgi:hypothetical protein
MYDIRLDVHKRTISYCVKDSSGVTQPEGTGRGIRLILTHQVVDEAVDQGQDRSYGLAVDKTAPGSRAAVSGIGSKSKGCCSPRSPQQYTR